jgi:hypothetical protein
MSDRESTGDPPGPAGRSRALAAIRSGSRPAGTHRVPSQGDHGRDVPGYATDPRPEQPDSASDYDDRADHAGVNDRRRWPPDIAGRQLSERRAALDRLAGKGRHQAASHHRELSQPVDRRRHRNFPCRGMGAQLGANGCPPRRPTKRNARRFCSLPSGRASACGSCPGLACFSATPGSADLVDRRGRRLGEGSWLTTLGRTCPWVLVKPKRPDHRTHRIGYCLTFPAAPPPHACSPGLRCVCPQGVLPSMRIRHAHSPTRRCGTGRQPRRPRTSRGE